MTKTITISDSTYELIKEQLEQEKESRKTKLQIKTLAGEVLFESEKTTIKEAVEEAVSEDANLTSADLIGANLRGAYLEDAYLGGANLRGADLIGADLEDADFYHTQFYGRGGTTRIKQNQVDDFFKALGVIVEE